MSVPESPLQAKIRQSKTNVWRKMIGYYQVEWNRKKRGEPLKQPYFNDKNLPSKPCCVKKCFSLALHKKKRNP